MKYVNLAIISCILIFINQAQALDCEIDYIAKKVEKDERWFGTVKETKVKSGTETGQGQDKNKCRDDALSKLIKDGWEITSEKIRLN